MLRKVITLKEGLKLTCGARARSVMARKVIVRGTNDQQKRAGLVDVAGAGDSSMHSLRSTGWRSTKDPPDDRESIGRGVN